MSGSKHFSSRGRALALAAVVALAATPAAAQAADVDLGTASPFVALGGSAVTNTGPSVLNGDLGVSPGTSLTGFDLPAVVNGATHLNDAVAAQAQADRSTAYDVAAGQPVSPQNELTGQDLGGKSLTPGAYRFTSSAQLTGQLTLDAQGDPDAQFVFEIGSTLTTASASSVLLVGEASPCNVFWQVGSSATLGSTTSFQGNLMTYADISLQNGAGVIGRLLAGGQISLINNVLDNSRCRSADGGTTPTAGDDGTGAVDGGGDGAGVVTPAGTQGAGTNPLAPTRNGTTTFRRTPRDRCTEGFSATVRGRMIARVVFTLDGRRIASRRGMPYQVYIRAGAGRHIVRAHVTFKDATSKRVLKMRYRACAAAARNPRVGPSQFTG